MFLAKIGANLGGARIDFARPCLSKMRHFRFFLAPHCLCHFWHFKAPLLCRKGSSSATAPLPPPRQPQYTDSASVWSGMGCSVVDPDMSRVRRPLRALQVPAPQYLLPQVPPLFQLRSCFAIQAGLGAARHDPLHPTRALLPQYHQTLRLKSKSSGIANAKVYLSTLITRWGSEATYPASRAT